MSDCECDRVDCPKHDGSYDCTPFCDICEGNQGYCPTHDEWEAEQAQIYLNQYRQEDNEKCDDGNCESCYPEHFFTEVYDEDTDKIIRVRIDNAGTA